MKYRCSRWVETISRLKHVSILHDNNYIQDNLFSLYLANVKRFLKKLRFCTYAFIVFSFEVQMMHCRARPEVMAFSLFILNKAQCVGGGFFVCF